MEVLVYAPRPLMLFRETAEPVNRFRSSLSASGFTVEDYAEGNATGFRAFRKAGSPADFFTTDDEGIPAASRQSSVTVERGFFTNSYLVDTEIDLGMLMKKELEMTPLVADIRFLLTLPVRPSEHNASSVSEDGKTLEWPLKPGGENRIRFAASTPGTGAILVIGLAVAAVSTAAATLLIRRRR